MSLSYRDQEPGRDMHPATPGVKNKGNETSAARARNRSGPHANGLRRIGSHPTLRKSPAENEETRLISPAAAARRLE